MFNLETENVRQFEVDVKFQQMGSNVLYMSNSPPPLRGFEPWTLSSSALPTANRELPTSYCQYYFI